MVRKRVLDPKIIRVGDDVRVVNDRPVLRVGYPKAVKDYYQEVEDQLGGDLTELIRKTEEIDKKLRYTSPSHQAKGIRKLIIHNLAYLRAKADGFGGRERQIFFGEPLGRSGCLARVAAISIKQTGTYYPPYSSVSYYGEYDHEDGGLSSTITHKILELDFYHCYEESHQHEYHLIQEFDPDRPRRPQYLATDVEKVFDSTSREA